MRRLKPPRKHRPLQMLLRKLTGRVPTKPPVSGPLPLPQQQKRREWQRHSKPQPQA